MVKIMSEERAGYIADALDPDPASAPESVEFRDPIKELGFARMEHIIGLDVSLSDGAYRTLATLHYFWQRKDAAWPSLDTLAKLRGKSAAAIKRHLAELKEKKLISRERRFDDSSITYLEDLPQEYIDAARDVLQKRSAKRSKMTPQTAQKRANRQLKNELLKRTIEEEPLKESSGAKSAPHANKEKPTARRQNATVSPQAQERIEQARAALEEFGRKNDVEIAAGAAIASPVESERVFVRRVAPMIAALFPQRDLISDDRVAAKRIYALRADEEWLAERLTAYANGQGDEFRHPAKDGQQPNSFWVWKRLEKEWSIYRKEKADAEQRQAERERYERECAAAIAYAQQQNICLSGSDAQSDSVHLSGAAGRTGGPGTGDKPEDGIAVDAARELQVRGNGVGLSDVPGGSVGDRPGETSGRSVREMYRDNRRKRYLATLDGRVPKHDRAAA